MAFDLSGVAGIGTSAATGNFVGAGLGILGLGASIFGGLDSAQKAQEAYGVQSQITGLEGQVNDQRQLAMQLSARRQQTEIVRNNQRARALALNSATNQGAQFGSGLQTGIGQVNSQSTTNLNGVSQNLQIGESIFGLNRTISQDKLQLSSIQSKMATDQGISSLGGALTKSSDPISKMLQQWGAGGPITLGGPSGPTPFTNS